MDNNKNNASNKMFQVIYSQDKIEYIHRESLNDFIHEELMSRVRGLGDKEICEQIGDICYEARNEIENNEEYLLFDFDDGDLICHIKKGEEKSKKQSTIDKEMSDSMEELIKHYENTYGIPKGYVPAMDRVDGEWKVTHLYKGTFNNMGLPMCKHGWNRGNYYSVFRNNISKKGICKTCLKRAKEGLDGVESQ